MKISAIGVVSKDFKKSVEFYEILGFKFPEYSDEEKHLEPITEKGDTRLMFDHYDLAKELLDGQEPNPSNHSTFAIEFPSAKEIDVIVEKLRSANFKIVKEPWDAFWGQRYCVVSDPDGYLIDLFAYL